MSPKRTLLHLTAPFAICLTTIAADPQPAPQVPPTAPAPSGKPRPMVLDESIEHVMAERLAKQLIAASPIADPGDVTARDAAATKLADCTDLLEAAGGRILWGGYHPDQGYDPDAYRLNPESREDFFQLTELNPMVWAKLYLSTFMFTGPYEIKTVGRLTVLELDAKFRADLDAGEYPYPFWHSVNKWTAYVNARRVALVFSSGRLLSAMRVAPPPLESKLIKRAWDTTWNWTDQQGNEQPRVALYSYLFSKDNPHVAELDASFRALEESFRKQECLTCHSPDNRSRINDLLLLNYPNQALIARRSLVSMLEYNRMPPGDKLAHEPGGIQDEAVLADLLKLARSFEKTADDAFAYERLHKHTPTDVPDQPTSAPTAPATPAAEPAR